MTRECSLTGAGIRVGNNVSNSNCKTKRVFVPNLQNVTLKSDFLNKTFHLKLTTRTIRTITKYGSLDEYLLHTKAQNMTEFGARLKRKLKKMPEVVEKIKKEVDSKKSKVKFRQSARVAKKKKAA